MSERKKHLKLLLADDDKSITNVYKLGLPSFFNDATASPPESLETGTSASITVCSQGAAAIELFQEAMQSGEPYDVIVLDIRMPPGMSGVDAGEIIRELDPKVPIVFVSGYTDMTTLDLQKRVPPPSRLRFMEKPIQLADLAQQIHEAASVA